MTLPEQSDRAVAQTRAFLVRLASPYVEGGIKGIRREVRDEASRMLRHYPYVWSDDCPAPDNAVNADTLAPEVRRLDDLITASQTTLTDAERAAVTTAMHAYGEDNADEECAEIEATLWGLLERL